MIKKLIPSCIVVLFVFSNFAYSHTHYGRVVEVSDGDTIKILTSENRQLKIRLAEIDAPEKKQAYGKKAANALALMIDNILVLGQHPRRTSVKSKGQATELTNLQNAWTSYTLSLCR